MAGLFGFFLHDSPDRVWADRRFADMRARAAGGPGTGGVVHHAGRAWVGQIGPGILPGSLVVHGPPSEPVLLAEGECYHRDHEVALGESPGGPWSWVRRHWMHGGAPAMAAVDGLYTLALIEPAGPGLRLINDRYGSRRLYLLETPRAFVFASELGPLAAWPEAAEIDDQYVRQSVCLGSALDGRTWLARVRLMPSATEIAVTPGRVSARRYWYWDHLPPAAADPPGPGLPRPLQTELRARWQRALGARLQGDRIGQLLSGGLDSRLILADAADLRRRDWVAVTYGEPGSDEVRFARAAAAAAGVRWELCPLPEPDWLHARTRHCLAHDGVVDIVNAFLATTIDRLGALMRWEISGYLGDLVLGATYDVTSAREALSRLPYWHSPIAMPEAEALALAEASLGSSSGRAWLVETKCRRAINAWPHSAVGALEVRKPFMDYALVEFAAALPRACRRGHDAHRALLAHHPRLARVPWQKTGAAPFASPLAIGMTRARRVLYRMGRAALARAGVELAPWVRGAVALDTWLQDPRVRSELSETLLATQARIGRLFEPAAVRALLQATLADRSVAHEPLLHLYLAEKMLVRLSL